MPEHFIPLSVPKLGEVERKAMDDCISSGWVSSASQQVSVFERAMEKFTGAQNAVAVSSGSAALFLALKMLGLKKDEIVLMPNLTFIATANAAVHLGATPVLVDVDPRTWQMDIQLAERFLSEECVTANRQTIHKESGKRVWGFIPVHATGYPGEVLQWKSLAEKFSLRWVEDAAAAVGSFRDGIHAGLTGDAGILSFNGNKILTTGGGGMVLTRDQALSESILHISTQAFDASKKGEYAHSAHGHNLRLTGLAAALGLAQLERMAFFLERKRFIHDFYLNAFAQTPAVCPWQNPAQGITSPNHWLFTVSVPDPNVLKAHLAERNIETKKLWIPLNRQSILQDCRYLSERDHSWEIYQHGLWLPSSTGITESELDAVAKAVKDFF